MNVLLSRFSFLMVAFVLTASALSAQNLDAVRQRMAERLPQLDRLKAAGVIGETNRGFVEARTTPVEPEVQTLSQAENNDRSTVYAAIARSTGAKAEDVGRARARQIATASAAGVWLQDERGAWYRK